MSLEAKCQQLQKCLRELDSVVIGFSGGVDSSLLVAVAQQTLGNKVLAVTVASPFCPKTETQQAEAIAIQVGCRHKIIMTNPLADPIVAANPPDRCYYCKMGIFSQLQAIAAQEGLKHVADGSNADDIKDYRPGMKAIKELQIVSPLQSAGLTKLEIRELSKRFNLPTWKKESAACLASRIPYGEMITPVKLQRVEQAEAYLSKYNFARLRVRSHADLARIEVSPVDLAKFFNPELRKAVVEQLKKLGFKYVAVDLEGYRTGSLNEVLQKK